MLHTVRSYPTIPSLPERGPLPPMIGVIQPVARTNLITNPSFERNATGWNNLGSGVIDRSTSYQYYGAYAGFVDETTAIGDGTYYSIALTSGTTYAFSFKVLAVGIIGTSYQLAVMDTSNNVLAARQFVTTGRWQWISLIYKAPSSTTYRFALRKADNTGNPDMYLDGVQCEAITDSVLSATTYIDGDQPGLLPGQQPPAYGWNGTPHASTSYRTALTRAGGYLVNLQEAYGFLLTGLVGLGMAAPNNVSIPYSVLDGARYIRTTKPPRSLTLPGRFAADTVFEQMQQQSAMRAAFDRDATPLQQPLVLQVEPQDECGNVIGDFAQVQCLYAGGLEGNENNYPAEDAAPTFTMYVPFLIGGSAGSALSVQSSVSNANAIVTRSPSGVWSAMSTGMSGGTPSVLSVTIGQDGTVYAGGNFTDAGGSGADYLAQWNGSAWAVVKSATSIGNVVRALAVGPDGIIYIGGDFDNADGIANADRIVAYNPTSNTYAALSTGANGSVYGLAFDSAGNLYAVGNFTTIGGVVTTGIAKWDGSAWSALGTGANAIAYSIAVAANDYVYVGGAFTTLGGTTVNGVGVWNGSAWAAMNGGVSGGGPNVFALAIGPDGRVYAGGDFTAAGGVSAASIAVWNGSAWAALGSGTNGSVTNLFYGQNSILYAGGSFTAAGGLSLPDRFARWNGSAWLIGDIDLPGTANINRVIEANDGSLYLGFSQTGSAVAAATTTVTNTNKALSYPVVTINGPSSGTSRIYQLRNYTTGAAIYFNLTLLPGEVVTMNFNPQSQSFMSSFQGDISDTILPGSTPALFYLAPGSNVLSFYASASSTTAFAAWQKRYNGLADLVN